LFAKTAFQIDLEARTCTCPNGQTTADLRLTKHGGGTFVFATDTCATCPLRAKCTRGGSGRTVHLHPYEGLLQQARELQRSPEFAEARRRRQVVEHRIARLVHLGIRQARYFGRTKTLFQVCLAAAVANLTLLASTSDTLHIGRLYAAEPPILTIAASLSVSLVAGLAAIAIAESTLNAHRIRPTAPELQRLQAGSRPAF
jgi:hypothetical protein